MNSSYTKLNINITTIYHKNQFEIEQEYIINKIAKSRRYYKSFEMKVRKKLYGQHPLALSKTKARLKL